jgi:hypothetical protein
MASPNWPIEQVMGAALQNQSPGHIDYDMLEKERTARLQADLQRRLGNEFSGRQDGLRQIILKSVAVSNYEQASIDLDNYVQYKSVYPEFPPRVQQLVQHCHELINAIRSKRSLPGLSQLTMSKQKEIMDYVVAHFNELKTTLKTIERIAKEVSLSDIRSTVWFVKTASYTTIGFVVVYFFQNFNAEIGQPFWVVFEDLSNHLFTALYSMLNL